MPTPNPPERPAERTFGYLPDGSTVSCWTLRAAGLEMEVLNYGAIVRSLRVPDRNGKCEDVVLGFDHLEAYLADQPYLGAVIGRVAGPIPNARLHVDAVDYPLSANRGVDHLHGGYTGLDKRLWDARPFERSDGAPCIELTYHSPHLEEGYPAAVDFQLRYTLTHSMELLIETRAVSNQPTPVSLTHHGYFHLGGEGLGTIEEHELQILGEYYFPRLPQGYPRNEALNVQGTPADLRQTKLLTDIISTQFQAHGELYHLGEPGANRLAAKLHDPDSGRTMEVWTTQACLQFYSGKYLDNSLRGKRGELYSQYAGLCLECHAPPPAGGTTAARRDLVYPGKPQEHQTRYRFSP